MTQIDLVSVILPTFDPTEGLLTVVREVKNQGFTSLIVVNDGSRSDRKPLFDELAGIEGCVVLAHEVNRGKGAALKTGMAYFMDNCPDGIGVVSIDDDGQHLPEDVRRCAEGMAASGAMTLGVRDLRGPEVPGKSRIGNKVMELIFQIMAGIRISDTQTGLRAIPRKVVPALLDVPGNRFEYETNVLLAAKKLGIEIEEVPIRTVYLEGNKGTHFRAFADSLAIAFQFAKYAAGSLLSSGIDLLGFYIILRFVSGSMTPDRWFAILVSTVLARAISSSFNFFFNKTIVFGNTGQSTIKAAAKYFGLCGISMLLSSQLVALLANLPPISTAAWITAVKIMADSVLFVMNYFVQKKWVYQ